MNRPNIIISRQDLSRLDTLIGNLGFERRGKVGAFLLDELARAEVVDEGEVPSNVVAMHAQVRFKDLETGREHAVTLVYPQEAGAREGAVSVLTPVGSALLGLAEGQTISYETPDGRTKDLQVLKVLHQADSETA